MMLWPRPTIILSLCALPQCVLATTVAEMVIATHILSLFEPESRETPGLWNYREWRPPVLHDPRVGTRVDFTDAPQEIVELRRTIIALTATSWLHGTLDRAQPIQLYDKNWEEELPIMKDTTLEMAYFKTPGEWTPPRWLLMLTREDGVEVQDHIKELIIRQAADAGVYFFYLPTGEKAIIAFMISAEREITGQPAGRQDRPFLVRRNDEVGGLRLDPPGLKKWAALLRIGLDK